MKRIIFTLIYLFSLPVLATPLVSASENAPSDYTIILSEDRDNKTEIGDKRRRDFIWTTTCQISTDRVEIASIDKESIISYDIYDLYGQCIGSFFNERDFLSAVFTIKGELKIRIVMDTFSLSGYIEVK